MSEQVVVSHAAADAAPACDEAKEDTATLRTLTQEMYERVARYLQHEKLEIEVRLCTIDAGQDKASATRDEGASMRVVPHNARHRISVGVSPQDFDRLMTYVCSGRATHAAVPPVVRRSHVMDVRDRHGGRHIYAIADTEAGGPGAARPAPQYLSSEAKERLWVEDVVLRGRAYDVRLALSVERAIDAAPADVAVQVPRGYRRRKQRVSVSEDNFTYDLTKVRAADITSYEVEVEYGAHQEKLTKDGLYELVRRAVQLASLPELKGQRDADVFAARPDKKRWRPRNEGRGGDAKERE